MSESGSPDLDRSHVVNSLDGWTNASDFFAPRFEEATKMGGKMIKVIQDAAHN